MPCKVIAVEGNTQRLDGGAMFGNAPREMWKKWLVPDDENRISLSCRSFLVQLNGHNILLEAGIGAFFEPKMRERFGVQEEEHLLITNLAKMGMDETDIDYVILSHLHFDHAGGLLPAYGSGREDLHFPKAKYVVSKVAFERSLHPHPRDRASYIPGLTDKLKASGRLIIIEGKTHPDVFPEYIHFDMTEGHTPGQLHTVIKTKESIFFFAGDLVPGCAWVHLPITMGYDRFAERVIDEKKALYEGYDLDKFTLLFTHDTQYPAAKVQFDDKGRYQAQPLSSL